METEQIASVTRGRVATRKGRLTISGERDIPLLELIRDCTYITRSQIEQLSRVPGAVRGFSKTESYRSRTRRLSRLVEIQQLATHGQMLPYQGVVYSIARAGLSTLEVLGNGLLSVTSGSDVLSNDRQISHYLGINRARVQLSTAFDIRKWWSDRVLQSHNISSNIPTVKDYDAIFELAQSPDRFIRVGLEYERTMKSRDRYAEIRRQLDREKSVHGVLYVVEGEQPANYLSQLVYSEHLPVATVIASQLEEHGAVAEALVVSSGRVIRSKLKIFFGQK
jgi:hypothetical protein